MVMMYALVRVDRRFFIPAEAHGAGEYSGEVVPEPPAEDDVDIYTLNPDGRTLSLADGRTFSIGDKRTFSMAERSSINRPSSVQPGVDGERPTSVDYAGSIASRPSQSYMTVNRKSGKYEMRNMSSSTLGTAVGEHRPESTHPLHAAWTPDET